MFFFFLFCFLFLFFPLEIGAWPSVVTQVTFESGFSTNITLSTCMLSTEDSIAYYYAGFRLACCSPLCRYAKWSSLAVSELQLSAATPLWLYHRAASLPRLSAVCRCGQSGGVIDLLARYCLPLGLPSAASGTCAVVQKSPSKRQCGERQASLKAALRPPMVDLHVFPSNFHHKQRHFWMFFALTRYTCRGAQRREETEWTLLLKDFLAALPTPPDFWLMLTIASFLCKFK